MNANRLPPLALLVLAAIGWWLAGALRIESGFAPFLGIEQDPLLSAVSEALAEGPIARQIVLRVDGPTSAAAGQAAVALAAELSAHPEIESARAGPDPAWRASFLRLFEGRAVLHLSDRPEQELPARLSHAGLSEAALRLRTTLAGPDGLWLASYVARDPLLALLGAVKRLEALEGEVRVVDGRWTGADGRSGLVLATTRHSPFATALQDPLQSFLAERFAALDRVAGGALVLEQASLHRFAVASARVAAREATVLTALSFAGAVAFLIAFFGSLRLLLLASVPLLAGTLVGAATTQLAFGSVHVLTLAFGSSLIGVCVDYPIHIMSHQAVAGGGAPLATLRRIAPALGLGAATTVAGFAALLFSDFAGVREMGAFASAGVLGGLLASCAITAPWTPRAIRVQPLQRAISERAERVLGALEQWPRGNMLLLAAALALGVSGLARSSWNDDVFSLNVSLDAAALSEDQRARAGVADLAVGRAALVAGRDDEEALVRNDALALCLAEAREAGELPGYRSLHALLWSEQLQRRNHAVSNTRPELGADLLSALSVAGFRADLFRRFVAELAEPPRPLTMREVLASPLAELVARFRLELPAGVALLTFLDARSHAAALEGRCGTLDGVRMVDQRALISGAYRGYRGRMLPILMVGAVGIVALAALRHRRIRPTLVATLPAGLAAATALGLLAWLGETLNLLHLLGALLVLGCGVDYGLFMVESYRDDHDRAATLASAIAACLTTVLSFGLLGLSSFPVLRAIGSSVSLGSALSLVFVLAAAAAFRLRTSR